MSYSIKPVDDLAKNLTGVEMTDCTPTQVKTKMQQMAAAYEVATRQFLTGKLNTPELQLPAGAWSEATYDQTSDTFSLQYQGAVKVSPVGATFDGARVMVPMV